MKHTTWFQRRREQVFGISGSWRNIHTRVIQDGRNFFLAKRMVCFARAWITNLDFWVLGSSGNPHGLLFVDASQWSGVIDFEMCLGRYSYREWLVMGGATRPWKPCSRKVQSNATWLEKYVSTEYILHVRLDTWWCNIWYIFNSVLRTPYSILVDPNAKATSSVPDRYST